MATIATNAISITFLAAVWGFRLQCKYKQNPWLICETTDGIFQSREKTLEKNQLINQKAESNC